MPDDTLDAFLHNQKLLEQRLNATVTNIAADYGVSPEVVEDVAGDVIVTSLVTGRGILAFDPQKGSFSGWLNTLIGRRVQDWKKRKRPKNSENVDQESSEQFTPPSDEIVGTRDHEQYLFGLLRILLTKYQSQILELRCLRNMTYREIAKVVGTNEQAVKKAMARARERIRDRIRKISGDAPPEEGNLYEALKGIAKREDVEKAITTRLKDAIRSLHGPAHE